MTAQNTSTFAKRLAWTIAGLNIVILLVAFVMLVVTTEPKQLAGASGDAFYGVIVIAIAATYIPMSMMILTRNPRHTIGWLFLLVSFFIAAQASGLILSNLNLPSLSGLTRLVEVLTGDLWIPSILIPPTLVLQFFPDGHLPSRRWWPITLAAILGMCFLYAGYTIHPWPWPEENINECCNPLAVEAGEGFFDLLELLVTISLGIGIFGSLASVVIRYRRSKGIERAQMKWLVYTALLWIVPILLLLFAGITDSPVLSGMFLAMPVVIAIAITVAILRYRLFDIDVIIRRTLVYTALTAMLALVYFGSVVLLQSLFEGLSGQESPIAIVISTLGIAALFTPLRRRVQDIIDRRFYRGRYNAEQVLAQFASAAQRETDIKRLTDELIGSVNETMQPKSVNLWIAPTNQFEGSFGDIEEA